MKFGIYIWHKSAEPTEYCIGEWNPAAKGYDGLTHEEAANKRIKAEQGKVGVFTDNYIVDATIVEDFKNFTKKAGADKEVHKTLRRFFGESVNIKGEWFKLPKSYKNPLDIFKHAIKATAECKVFTPERPFDYGPRKGSQDIAIDKVTKAFKAGKKKFLLGCKCRFGKTFTSYEIMQQNDFDNVLIMTFRPSDTKEAWLSDLNSHQDFKDYQFFNQNEIKSFSEFEGKKVLFISFQKAKISPEFEDMKKLHFDLVIVDEDQIGAHRIENRDLLNEVDNDFILVLTGTPELEIMSNEFEDDFYKFDYIDEQELKDIGWKEYADMPKLSLYSFNVEDKFTETISTKNGFALSEMFAITKEENKFKYPVSVKKFLDYISAESDNADFDIDSDNIGIFANPNFDLDHGLWKLPSIQACKLLKDILNKHNYFKSFAVEVLPESDKSPKELEDFCKKNNRTISLTVMKNTVGVTVKPWTYTMSLYGSDNSSLSSYIQYIFRAGSPGKSEFYSFDFCPSRVLDVVDSFAVARCADKTNNSDYTKAVANVINYLPVYAYNGSGMFHRVSSNELFKQISELTTYRSCRNLLLKDFEFLEDFSDELEGIEVESYNPIIAKNAALKKIKKELENKQKKKSSNKELSKKEFYEQVFQAFIDIFKWVKYDKDGIDGIDDFINKIESYRGLYEDFFGFSEDFMNAFICIVKMSKRNFGIAIERFKNLKYDFGMTDVPEELAEKMIGVINDNL